MARVASIVNHKGGVGKTTTAVSVAVCLGARGHRVLLIDLDPQGSASISLGIQDGGMAMLQALQKTVSLPLIPGVAPGVDLAPAGPHLSRARELFSGAIGSELLARCLRHMGDEWEWILIDCPPSLGILTLNALKTSRHVLIPVEASYLALRGLDQMIVEVRLLQENNRRLGIDAVIPCRAHPRRKVHGEIMKKLMELFPGKITPVVRENHALTEAPAHGRSILEYAPRSYGAEDYRQVTNWLITNLSGPAALD